MRIGALVLFFLTSCAEPEPRLAAPSSCPEPPRPDAEADSRVAPVEARTVAMRFETRTIGASAAESHSGWVGRPIDLDVKDADIQDVLRLLSDVGHANIVVADNVSGRVTVRMKHVPWDQALDTIATAKGLAVERDSNVLLVTPASTAARPKPAR